MSEDTRKQFDLEKALAGEPVETRGGESVTEITHFKSAVNESFTIVGVLNGEFGTWTARGLCFGSTTPHPRDLVMSPKKD